MKQQRAKSFEAGSFFLFFLFPAVFDIEKIYELLATDRMHITLYTKS